MPTAEWGDRRVEVGYTRGRGVLTPPCAGREPWSPCRRANLDS